MGKAVNAYPFQSKTARCYAEKHYGDVLHPTRWWGRMPFLFWLVALFVGFLERKEARLTPVMRAVDDPRFSGVPLRFLR